MCLFSTAYLFFEGVVTGKYTAESVIGAELGEDGRSAVSLWREADGTSVGSLFLSFSSLTAREGWGQLQRHKRCVKGLGHELRMPGQVTKVCPMPASPPALFLQAPLSALL